MQTNNTYFSNKTEISNYGISIITFTILKITLKLILKLKITVKLGVRNNTKLNVNTQILKVFFIRGSLSGGKYILKQKISVLYSRKETSFFKLFLLVTF